MTKDYASDAKHRQQGMVIKDDSQWPWPIITILPKTQHIDDILFH